MGIIKRGVSAVREGRALKGIERRLRASYDSLREICLRVRLGAKLTTSGDLPSVRACGNFSASADGARLKACFEAACRKESVLPARVRDIVGMSGQAYRSFINNYVRSASAPRYLEVGSWAGSTAVSALFGNRAEALCIDNWAEFGGPREEFFSNIRAALSEQVKFRFVEKDFRAVDFGSIGSFDIYLFDGPHEEADQYDGVVLAQPALARRHLLVVDDWNWRAVRNGTFRALIDTKCSIEAAMEVRTTLDDSHPTIAMEKSEWHNGYFIAVIVRRAPSA